MRCRFNGASRRLRCLVALELKIGKFKPEYVSKMDFYLEGLDRQVKTEDENPSVGLILCASKDDEVVEYAMSRALSPMIVAESDTSSGQGRPQKEITGTASLLKIEEQVVK